MRRLLGVALDVAALGAAGAWVGVRVALTARRRKSVRFDAANVRRMPMARAVSTVGASAMPNGVADKCAGVVPSAPRVSACRTAAVRMASREHGRSEGASAGEARVAFAVGLGGVECLRGGVA